MATILGANSSFQTCPPLGPVTPIRLQTLCVLVTDTPQVLIPNLVLKPPHKPRVRRCVGALPPPGALKEVETGQGRRLGTRS